MIRFCAVLIVLIFSSGTQAQDSLSLAKAISIGLERNFDIQIEKLNYQVAKNNNSWGDAGRWPSIDILIGQNNSLIERKPANPFQLSGRNFSNNLTTQADLNWVLFNGFSVNINKNRLVELEKLSLGNTQIAVENTIQNIILGYNLAVLEHERMEVRAKVLRLSKDRLEYVKLRREVGSAILFDVLQEQNAYLTDSSEFINQQLLFKNAIRNLNEVMNTNIETKYILTDTLAPIIDNYSYEDLHSKMLSNNANVRNQYINQSLLKYNTQLLQAGLTPSISLNTGVTTTNDRLNAQFSRNEPGVYSTSYGNSRGAYLNFTLRYTIFNGGQLKRSIENARIQERISTLNVQELEMTLQNDLLQLHDLFIIRKQLVQLADANIRAAELNVRLAEERYRNGFLSSIDYRFIQQTFLNTALNHLVAIYAVIETHSDLLRLTGGILREYQK